MKTVVLHTCNINYEDNEGDTMIYLENHLDLKEFETLFSHAKFHQEAYFQDRSGHHFLIEYRNGEYFLLRR